MNGFDIVWSLATEYFVLSFVVLLLILAGIYFNNGQHITALTFIGFGLVLGAGEAASIYFTNKTISENHWYLDASKPEVGFMLFLVLTALLLIIVVHLAKLTIKRLMDKK